MEHRKVAKIFFFIENETSPFIWERLRCLEPGLAVQVLARISIFHEDVDAFEIGVKVDMLALLAYVGRRSLYNYKLAH
jgi:hypothetical protein